LRDVAVVGVGLTKFGERWDASLRDLFTEAALAAMDDAGVDRVESLYVGNMSSGLFVGQEHLASLLTDYADLGNIPATRVETACASGGLAVKLGWMEVAAGISDVVMVSGVEKMTDCSGAQATFALATAADQEYEVYHGATFPGLYAMMARAHMHKYGTKREHLTAVSVKNHKNGAKNPYAQYPFEITPEAVESSVMIADPLRILDCSPITDGAAAAILVPADQVSKYKNHPGVKIIGVGHATDSIALASRPDITELKSTEAAAKRAYEMSGKTIEDMDVVEVHDCFTIAEIIVCEAIGLVEKGKGGPFVSSGATALGGKIPVNTSGGLKSKGHPVGATGAAQIHEIVTQLRGEAGDRQVEGARVGMTQNMGGSGGSTVVHILEAM
jgi:acetyl-CoA C-acetyltransferase